MSQGYARRPTNTPISVSDTRSVDGYSRLRVASPASVFDSLFTYNLLALVYEPIVSGTGATITHDATNRAALMTFAATPTGGKAFMQTYEYFQYQAGRSAEIFIAFNFVEPKANVLKVVGYSDGVNGIELQQNGSTIQFQIYSGTGNGSQTVARSAWNWDKFDGKGPSGITLDFTKTQILVIDFQASVGRVRLAFDVGGVTYGAHQFTSANVATQPYMQTPNLPIRVGMTCTGTASTTMKFVSGAILCSGGQIDTGAYYFTAGGAANAGNNGRAHLFSLRPKALFNGTVNRISLDFGNFDIANTGDKLILWEIVLGQAISGTTAFVDVDSAYSAFEYNNTGTISGSPAIKLASGFCNAATAAKFSESYRILGRMPITLDAAGAVRTLGTLSVLATGFGGNPPCQVALNWRELR